MRSIYIGQDPWKQADGVSKVREKMISPSMCWWWHHFVEMTCFSFPSHHVISNRIMSYDVNSYHMQSCLIISCLSTHITFNPPLSSPIIPYHPLSCTHIICHRPYHTLSYHIRCYHLPSLLLPSSSHLIPFSI